MAKYKYNFNLTPNTSLYKRKLSRTFLINHLYNCTHHEVPFDYDVCMQNNTYYTMDYIRYYYMELMGLRNIPFHFYVENIKGLYTIMNACALDIRSEILDDAMYNYIIQPIYKNCIHIVIKDFYGNQAQSADMTNVLVRDLISPLSNVFDMSQDYKSNIVIADDIFDVNMIEKSKEKYKWNYNPMKGFDKVKFFIDSGKYWRY